MSKKIIVSLITLGVIATIAVGGTIAYFSDVEKSTGNIMTAGEIDLKVDHRLQSYNNVECHTCGLILYSGTSDIVERTNEPAVPSWVHPNWDKTLPAAGATWIWSTEKVTNPSIDQSETFIRNFTWNGPITTATISFEMAADNRVWIELNGSNVYTSPIEHNYEVPATVNISTKIQQGANVLKIKVENIGIQGSTPEQNPAALIYKLSIGGNCSNGFMQECKLWYEPKDLDEGDTFFKFGDVKPGDYGRNLISLHVKSNDAYVCMAAKNQNDAENTLTEPELEMNPADTALQGELGSMINVFLWREADGNGQYNTGETSITGPIMLKDLNFIHAFDSNFPLPTGITKFVGMYWCAGTMTVDQTNGTFACNGSSVGNEAQSDSFQADLEFYAEQTRHNTSFVCPGERQAD